MTIEELFPCLDEDERGRIMTKALSAGGAVIRQKTKDNLRTRVKGTTERMTEGVRMKKDQAYQEVTVHIMGYPVLRILEKGTVVRKTKAGANRGRISGYWFFKDARQDTGAVDTAITNEFERLVSQYIK